MTLQERKLAIAQMQTRLARTPLVFRDPPQEPTTCCGRGCNGCVWEGYEAALAWWLEETAAQLSVSA